MYGIFLKVKISQCEGKKFTEAHTGVEKKLQGRVCTGIRYMLDKLVVLVQSPRNSWNGCAFPRVRFFRMGWRADCNS